MYDNELYHYGVKGMHWGVRRYRPYSEGESGKEIGEARAIRSKRAAKVAGAALGATALAVAANTPTGRAALGRAVGNSIGRMSPGKKAAIKRFGREVKVGATTTFHPVVRVLNSHTAKVGAEKTASILGKSAGTALGVIATGSAIYAGEQYLAYKHGLETSKKIVQYGRQPVKKK